MNPYLSIIIPCYNCSSTLEESVASIYIQGIKEPYEIVVVDDGSADDTRALIIELSKKHKEIRYFFHERNQGGGAARNTAVENSRGEVIFCLDSDDILPEMMLPRMLETMRESGADGVVFEKSVFFKINVPAQGNSNRDYHEERRIPKPVVLANLFESGHGFLTQVNFLYKKGAFKRAGGYPVNHGFDTQGYGFRFLAAGNRVVVCPGSYYFHRQGFKKRSYFERVYENGEFSKNIYLIMEEIIYLFSPDVCSSILTYDIFVHNRLGSDNLKSFLDAKAVESGERIFDKDNKKDFEAYYEIYKDSQIPIRNFVCAVYEFRIGQYQSALARYEKLALMSDSQVLSYNIMRCAVALSGKCDLAEFDKETFELVRQFLPKETNLSLRFSLSKRIILKIIKLIR